MERRISELEEAFASEPSREPSESFSHLRAILDELAFLKASCAHGLRGGAPIVPENVPRRILGPGYTHGELMGLAVSRSVEAGRVPAGRAGAYLEHMREMRERNDRDPNAVADRERRGA